MGKRATASSKSRRSGLGDDADADHPETDIFLFERLISSRMKNSAREENSVAVVFLTRHRGRRRSFGLGLLIGAVREREAATRVPRCCHHLRLKLHRGAAAARTTRGNAGPSREQARALLDRFAVAIIVG